MGDDLAGEVTELLQQLIRNACVNDGTPGSGHEQRNAQTLVDVLEGSGLELQRYEPLPGRTTVVARIDGRVPGAPSLTLLGHTDVVPATPEDWRRDPFGGELVDGEVWGRGAIDMLNLTAAMAVAVRQLADDGFRPTGDLVFVGVADEEAAGRHGAGWLVEHAPEDVRTDFLLTEAGGFPMTGTGGVRLPVVTGEKGAWWGTLTVHGTPGHGSQPLRTDNALVTAAEVVRRLAAHRNPAELHPAWRAFVEGLGLPAELAGPLLDPDAIDAFCDQLPLLGLARQAHACTHTTVAPTVLHAGTKVNVIPDRAQVQVDIRVLPGWDRDRVEGMLAEALGDLAGEVAITWQCTDLATESPTDTTLWRVLERAARHRYPGARCVPFPTAGATDARFFRRLGTVAYGFGLFSERLRFEDYAAMFHGVDERVDVESLGLSAQLFVDVCRELLG